MKLHYKKFKFWHNTIGLLLCLTWSVGVWGQITYTMGNTSYYSLFSNGGGSFSNASDSELGMWANVGSKQAVAWRKFHTNGTNNEANRNLQIGDLFTITVSATSAFGSIGFSLNASPNMVSWDNRHSNSRLYVQVDGTNGSWYVNSAAGNQTLSYNVSTTRIDYQFRVLITSHTTCNVELFVNGGFHSRLNNLTMNGAAGANITDFVLYLSDDWNGSSNQNIYWKQTTTHNATGTVNLGYFLTSGIHTPGLVSNGLANNTTSTSNTNVVNVGGDAGSSVVLAQANTYSGLTTVNSNATLRLGVSSTSSTSGPLGTTGAGTTVTSGGVLDMNGFSLTSSATEALTIDGTGISSGGALINSSGTGSTWSGDVTIGSSGSIGGTGNVTISGVISGSNNLAKVGDNSLIFTGANTYTGTTTISAGTLQLNRSGGTTIPSNNIVTVNSGATLRVSSNQSLSELNINGGTVTIDSGVTLTVETLNVTEGAFSGSGTLRVNQVLNKTTSGVFNTNGQLILSSNASNSAKVAPVTGSISGNVTVERFIPAKRAWRLLTAPLTNATNATIQTHWQNTGTGTGLLLWNPNQVAGMQTGQGIANIYRFGSPSAGWNAINNTTTEPLFGNEVNHAFLVFATAPANETNVTASAQATTLRPTGSLRVGDVAYTNLPANTYRLLGNPYASALDIGLLKSQNPAAFGTLWFLDPNLGDFGGYVTYNGSAFAPSANTNPAHTYSTTNTRIESGQAFFVRPSAEATFTFTESQKASNVSYSMAKPATSSTNSLNGIRANLYKTVNQNPIITDGILAIFDANETNEVNGNDSRKFTNNNENIMFRNSNISISIENRALPLAQDELLIRLTNTGANQNYQLRLFTENYTNSLIQPYLQDALTQQLTAIPIDGSELIYPFNGITSSNASPDERFKIVFQNNPLGFDNNQLGSIAVFPNPINDGYFDIQLPYLVNETLNYAIYNMQGQLIIPENDLAPAVINHRIQTSGLAKGVYLLKVKGANQEWCQKIIVN